MTISGNSLARERILSLLDQGSFVEIGAAVTARSTDFSLSEKKEVSDGVITGYGHIGDRAVYVYSQDSCVLGGSIGEMHAKKISALYDLAMTTGDPVIGLIDCAGLRLEEGLDALEAFGAIWRAQTEASGVIPQISAIFGMCGGSMAMLPSLSDFTFIEKDKGRLFFQSPNAIPGSSEESCDTSSAQFRSRVAGSADLIGSAEEIVAGIRSLVALLPSNCEGSLYDPQAAGDLNRIDGDLARCIDDPALILARICDGGIFFESRPEYGRDMVTALTRIGGYTAGVIANRTALIGEDGSCTEAFDGRISADGAHKAERFAVFCDAYSIPVVTLTNAQGFAVAKEEECRLADEAARLAIAFAATKSPKINMVTGTAYGSAYLIMNSRALGADLVFAWKDARIGMIEGRQAARVLVPGGSAEEVEEAARAYDEKQGSSASAAARGYVDALIEPSETRKYLIGALDMLSTKRELPPRRRHSSI